MKIHDLSLKDKKCELNSCLRHVMLLCRWFGLYPVEGLTQEVPERIRFTLKSPYTCYYVISLVGQIFMTGFSFYDFLGGNMSLTKLTNFLFYLSGLVNLSLMFRLAKNWPRLVKKAMDIELSLTEIRLTRNTSTKTTIMAYVVMILALIEHILSKVASVNVAKWCLGASTLNFHVMEQYFMCSMSFIFNYVPYNIFAAILFLFICMQTTFIWSVTDVLTMCVSTYLTSYFQDLNKAISCNEKKTKKPWGQLRVHYSHLAVLVKQINSNINTFILLSFFSNLFFICVQLFNSLHRGYWQDKICKNEQHDDSALSPEFLAYYLFSFLFLVLRALMLSILAANVHSAAREPLVALYDVPASEYNIDVSTNIMSGTDLYPESVRDPYKLFLCRFLDFTFLCAVSSRICRLLMMFSFAITSTQVKRFQLQLRYTTIGLSGVFFCVTRKMILKVVGTIITYELVLLQFSKDDFQQSGEKNHTKFPFYYEI